MTDKIVTLRGKGFSGHGIENLDIMVSPDGTLRVYDSVAGHYTTCHSLSASAARRARKLANERK